MNKVNIQHLENQEDATETAALALNEIFAQNLNTHKLFLVSGGSALKILDYIKPEYLNEELTVTLVDERFSEDPEINNFLNLQKTAFFQTALEREVHFIGTLPRPGEIVADMVSRFEMALKNWKNQNPQGKIIALFGMGTDGHTAGIFPFPENPKFFSEEFESSKWVVGYTAPQKAKFPQRVTTTFTFFKNIDHAVLFTCGKEKAQCLQNLISGQGQPHTLPALGLYETKNLEIFTDIGFK